MSQKFLCGVPHSRCVGGHVIVNHSIEDKVFKAHGTSEEAFKCKAKTLLEDGYERIGPREFRKPGHPILVLTRKSKFGTRLRMGKNQEGKGSRFEPYSGGGFIHGC